MTIGTKVYTPRFCTVTIEKIFNSREEAMKESFSEPTFFDDPLWIVVGKSLDLYHMAFAAYPKQA